MLDFIRNLPPQEVVLAAVCCLSVGVWVLLAALRGRRVPLLPFERRRPVPWRGLDVLAVVVFQMLLGWMAFDVARFLMGPELALPIEAGDGGKEDTRHSIARMLVGAEAWLTAVAVFSVVVVTPIAEELMYRVLLQGWLEAVGRRWRRRLRSPRLRSWLAVVAPVVLSSLVFAAMHYRVATPAHHRYYYFGIMLAVMATNVLTVAFAVAWTRLRAGATAADWGWAPQRLWRDVRTGVVAFLAIAAPLYLVQDTLGRLLPEDVAPDPLAIFLFALLLGTLYHRTHRGTPAVVTHAMLNATSLALLWLQTAV